MSYVVFLTYSRFQDNQELLAFLTSCFVDVWIQDIHGEKRLTCLDDIDLDKLYESQKFWYIHGSCLSSSSLCCPQSLFSLKDPLFSTSLEIIDAELECLLNKYAWTLLPWGGIKRFSSLAFISKNEEMYHQLIANSSTCQRLIANYTISYRKLSQTIRSALLRGHPETDYPMWNILSKPTGELLAVTEIGLSEELSIFEWWNPDDGYEWVASMPISRENTSEELNVYKITKKEAFQSMCNLLLLMPSTLVFVPSNTELSKLTRLLTVTENRDSYTDLKYYGKPKTRSALTSEEKDAYNYSDLICIDRILDAVEWFFGMDRDMADYSYSFFVARDKKLIQLLDDSLQYKDSGLRLVSCF